MTRTQPALGSVVACFLEDRARPSQPPVLDCPVTEDVPGDPRRRAGRPPGRHLRPLVAVRRVRALVLHGRGGVRSLEVQGLGDAFEFLAGVGHRTRCSRYSTTKPSRPGSGSGHRRFSASSASTMTLDTTRLRYHLRFGGHDPPRRDVGARAAERVVVRLLVVVPVLALVEVARG